jgi:hypothetical protein
MKSNAFGGTRTRTVDFSKYEKLEALLQISFHQLSLAMPLIDVNSEQRIYRYGEPRTCE